ncbi:hypothetical protein LRH25_13675 [Ideonella azotifigens]|uniref:Uncharacterized protein n=2 Tax=Ideonella azotifigens TaxID=513160 RepID=A0ABN1JXZ9_9BURK|nr:hypothetical protein [Ideonella azotifigens]MCD2341392.1 hypothetical protein [Ideonella azotifigens]
MAAKPRRAGRGTFHQQGHGRPFERFGQADGRRGRAAVTLATTAAMRRESGAPRAAAPLHSQRALACFDGKVRLVRLEEISAAFDFEQPVIRSYACLAPKTFSHPWAEAFAVPFALKQVFRSDEFP